MVASSSGLPPRLRPLSTCPGYDHRRKQGQPRGRDCYFCPRQEGARRLSFWPILLQKSAVTDDVVRPFQLGRRGLVPRRRRSLRNSYATQYTEPERVAVAQPAIRAAAGSEQWRPEQTRPERLVDHAIEVDRASGSHLSGATAGF